MRVCPPVSSATPATTISTFSPVVVIIASPGWQVPTGAICSCKSSKKFASATCLWWVGYVVMPDHIHLLISEPERGTPSTVMQVVKQRFARRVLNRQRRDARQAELWPEPPQHVWQKRFYDFHVWSERKRVEKLRYMHRNPVKEGLVQEPEQWPWSSYRSYAYDEVGRVKINQWPKAEMRRPAA